MIKTSVLLIFKISAFSFAVLKETSPGIAGKNSAWKTEVGKRKNNIVLKRCLNYLDKGGVIICKSDNKDPQYPTFPLPVENIKEVWKFKIKLTRQAPEPSGLYERINSLEGDMVWLKEQLKKSFLRN